MKDIHEVAQVILDNMDYDVEKEVWHQKTPGNPKWIQDIIYKCHYEGMLPDDYVFEWVHDFCVDISDEDFDEEEYNIITDDYTHDLLKWLSSNLNRLGWVDEVYDECYNTYAMNFDVALGMAQEREMRFVLETLVDGLRKVCDSDEDDE